MSARRSVSLSRLLSRASAACQAVLQCVRGGWGGTGLRCRTSSASARAIRMSLLVHGRDALAIAPNCPCTHAPALNRRLGYCRTRMGSTHVPAATSGSWSAAPIAREGARAALAATATAACSTCCGSDSMLMTADTGPCGLTARMREGRTALAGARTQGKQWRW